jgi:hypothetical protein
MTLAADYQMVVDGNPQRFGGLADLLRHLDVVARGLGVARRMVVQQRSMRTYDIDFQGDLPALLRQWDMEWGSVVCDPT